MPVKKTQSGTVDKRTKEGKAIAERMAKARAAIGTSKPAKKTTKTATKTATTAITSSITRSVLNSLLGSSNKPAAKPVSKPTVTEITVNGNKKIETLMKEFNKKFPCLQLCIFYSYARNQVSKGESITPVDRSKTLASVRRADTGGTISISGNKKIKSLEKEFDTVFGLYAQVCYYSATTGKGVYTSGANDEKTLAAFNAECEKNGCKKGEWK